MKKKLGLGIAYGRLRLRHHLRVQRVGIKRLDSMASTEVTINYSGDIEDLRYKGNTTLYDSYIVII
jgi:hypothetical protein